MHFDSTFHPTPVKYKICLKNIENCNAVQCYYKNNEMSKCLTLRLLFVELINAICTTINKIKIGSPQVAKRRKGYFTIKIDH